MKKNPLTNAVNTINDLFCKVPSAKADIFGTGARVIFKPIVEFHVPNFCTPSDANSTRSSVNSVRLPFVSNFIVRVNPSMVDCKHRNIFLSMGNP